MAGRTHVERATVQARLAVKVNSEVGRTEYLLVGLVEANAGPAEAGHYEADVVSGFSRTLVAYPMGQGSGSVTTFSRADGFTTIGRHEEIVPAGTMVDVQLLGRALQLADLVAIGSHCIGLDYLLGELEKNGVRRSFSPSAAWADSKPRSAANATSPASTSSIRRAATTTGRS